MHAQPVSDDNYFCLQEQNDFVTTGDSLRMFDGAIFNRRRCATVFFSRLRDPGHPSAKT
jgi:hypothetical protein